MLFKITNSESAIMPTGFCPGIDCGPYTCNEPTADKKATEAISVQENKESAKKSSPTSA